MRLVVVAVVVGGVSGSFSLVLVETDPFKGADCQTLWDGYDLGTKIAHTE